MKRALSVGLWLLAFALMAAPPAILGQRKQVLSNPRLAAEIENLFAAGFMKGNIPGVSLPSRIRLIFAQSGIPSDEMVGEEPAAEYVVLLSGEPLSFIETVLPALERAALAGKVSDNLYIYLRAQARQKEIRQKFSGQPENPALQGEIERLYRTDQSVRPTGKKPWNLKKQAATDRAESVVAHGIFAKYGLPTYALVGLKAAGKYDTVVQHQSLDFEKQVLPQMRAALKAGQASPESYAMLLDRVESSSGQPQTYGENFVCAQDGKGKPSPIGDPQRVDRRRAEIGLMPLALYAKALGALYMNNLCTQVAAANRSAASIKTASPHR